MSSLIKGIAHTAYTVSDMKGALKFYHDAFGFERAFDIPDSEGRPWIIYIHALATHIERAGYRLDPAPRFLESDNNWQAWVRDPDGNHIELM